MPSRSIGHCQNTIAGEYNRKRVGKNNSGMKIKQRSMCV